MARVGRSQSERPIGLMDRYAVHGAEDNTFRFLLGFSILFYSHRSDVKTGAISRLFPPGIRHSPSRGLTNGPTCTLSYQQRYYGQFPISIHHHHHQPRNASHHHQPQNASHNHQPSASATRVGCNNGSHANSLEGAEEDAHQNPHLKVDPYLSPAGNYCSESVTVSG